MSGHQTALRHTDEDMMVSWQFGVVVGLLLGGCMGWALRALLA